MSSNFVAMKLAHQIPNALTLTNLLLGMLAIISMTNALVETALWLMAGSLVADVLDGAIARRMGISGGLGVQLDSLADMVTFGVLPAMMIFYCGARFGGGTPGQQTIAIFASLSAVSAGLRLGRFNLDTRPREYFWGLATPAGGIMVAGWLWAQHIGRDYGFGVADMPWLGVIVPVFLIIAFQVPLKLPGLKSPKAGIFTAIGLAILTVAGLVFFGPIAIPAGIVGYVMVGVLNLGLRWY
jgi:CDP-diacylglycerol--serine O-phosphatidyltransferase